MANITLRWQESKNGYWFDTDAGYRVSKQYDLKNILYTAWDNQRGNNRKIIKAGCKSADEAKAECELFAMRNKS